ncbi:ParA family protein [Streptomyces sp. NPDC015144]|uniref:ParA family protein n=1 Tax=Streptomyces sp. NPDC015144 TaxID=3364944 RepID=UPI0036F74DB9
MARRIAIGNNKGGAKKSTHTVRLAEALAKAGKVVGVAEMDPQGNASRRLGYKDDPSKLTVSEAIAANAEGVAAQVWHPIGWQTEYADRITLLPARHTLEDRALEAGQRGAYRRFAKALHGADDHLDYLLIDCQPSFGHLTQMALAAAHYAVASTECEHDCIGGAVKYRDFVADAGIDLANPDLEFLGIIVGEYDQRVPDQRDQVAGVREIFGDAVWGVIPQRAVIAYADGQALPLDQVPRSGPSRAAFELLAERLMKEVPA